MLLNIPMFILGYIYLSKRFLAHSSLAMFSLSAFFMVENTFNVPGSTFSKRKIY